MEITTTDEYYCKDLGQASALLCKSAKLIRLQKENNFYWFVFADKPLCEQLSQDFWFGELLVNAKTYCDSFRNLKDRLYAIK
jgi:hypothetical protein